MDGCFSSLPINHVSCDISDVTFSGREEDMAGYLPTLSNPGEARRRSLEAPPSQKNKE